MTHEPKQLKKSLVTDLGKSLKTEGFIKKGTTWNKKIDELVYVIDLQFSNHDFGSFTLNFGFIDTVVWGIRWPNKSEQNFFKETDCFKSFRISEVLKSDYDIWFDISADLKTLKEEILGHIVNNGIPFIKRFYENLAVSVLPRNAFPSYKLNLAIFYFIKGMAQESKLLLEEVENVSKGWSKEVSVLRGNLIN